MLRDFYWEYYSEIKNQKSTSYGFFGMYFELNIAQTVWKNSVFSKFYGIYYLAHERKLNPHFDSLLHF